MLHSRLQNTMKRVHKLSSQLKRLITWNSQATKSMRQMLTESLTSKKEVKKRLNEKQISKSCFKWEDRQLSDKEYKC